jgi:hypothetical protein
MISSIIIVYWLFLQLKHTTFGWFIPSQKGFAQRTIINVNSHPLQVSLSYIVGDQLTRMNKLVNTIVGKVLIIW